ncbi:MAG: hypothetical protein ABIV28_04125 [Longimicrobiales bacterium]
MSVPDPASPPRKDPDARALHTTLLLPSEARWSRPSSILLSVAFHLALLVAIRHWIWQPLVSKPGPVFHVFRLNTPEPAPPPIAVPIPPRVIPPVQRAEGPQVRREDETRVTAPLAPGQELVEPTTVPDVLPQPGSGRIDGIGDGGPPRTPAERLLRTGINPGLAVPRENGLIPPVLTPQEVVEARRFASMKAYNDSLAAAIADADHSKDWVKKGKDGKQWGIAPDGIYIGSVKLPLPNFGFAGPPGRREETAGKLRGFAEGNAQAKRMEMEQTFESRVKAMRARKDAQRDSVKSAKRGG